MKNPIARYRCTRCHFTDHLRFFRIPANEALKDLVMCPKPSCGGTAKPLVVKLKTQPWRGQETPTLRQIVFRLLKESTDTDPIRKLYGPLLRQALDDDERKAYNALQRQLLRDGLSRELAAQLSAAMRQFKPGSAALDHCTTLLTRAHTYWSKEVACAATATK